MHWTDWIAFGAGIVVAGCAVLAWIRAGNASRIARESNTIAGQALAAANEANRIATDLNEIAREANQIQHEVKHAQTMPALKAEQIEALKSLHRKTHNNLRLPGTTKEIAEEWESKIKNLAFNAWQEWEHVLSRDPALGLPMKADEVKRIINEFCARAKMTPLP